MGLYETWATVVHLPILLIAPAKRPPERNMLGRKRDRFMGAKKMGTHRQSPSRLT